MTHFSVGVIGAGRVGAVLAAALRDAGHEVAAAAGESDASRARIATLLPGTAVVKPSEAARAAGLLLLTVPDDMLRNVVAMLSASGAIREGQYVVHTSGAHGLAVLADAAAVGARPIALHPAMTFTGTDVDLPRLREAVFGVTAGDEERAVTQQLVDDLGGRSMWVAEDKRTLYHAALAHGANHLVTLVAQAAQLLREAGVEPADRVLGPLLHTALDDALLRGDDALTGPVARADAGTVSADRAVISDVTSRTGETDVLAAYQAMARATAQRALASGRLKAGVAEALLDALAD